MSNHSIIRITRVRMRDLEISRQGWAFLWTTADGAWIAGAVWPPENFRSLYVSLFSWNPKLTVTPNSHCGRLPRCWCSQCEGNHYRTGWYALRVRLLRGMPWTYWIYIIYANNFPVQRHIRQRYTFCGAGWKRIFCWDNVKTTQARPHRFKQQLQMVADADSTPISMLEARSACESILELPSDSLANFDQVDSRVTIRHTNPLIHNWRWQHMAWWARRRVVFGTRSRVNLDLHTKSHVRKPLRERAWLRECQRRGGQEEPEGLCWQGVFNILGDSEEISNESWADYGP